MNSRLLDLSRRQLMQLTAAGVGTVAASGWMRTLADNAKTATPTGKQHKSCILLWMDGGPSHKDTFDLKPDSKGAGDFKQIQTSARGIEISEHLPNIAKQMHHGVVVRSMSTPEGAHPRAKYNLHTGYREGQGGLVYPSLGAITASELGSLTSAVPNFVSIGNRSYGAGFLGPKYQPLIVQDPTRGVEDLKSAVSDKQFNSRNTLLAEMESAFYHDYNAGAINDHRTTMDRAVKLMQSKETKAFDLTQESAKVKESYGSSKFGEGVLMARRLVEIGVPFVEVTLGGWDTHDNNFEKVKKLSGTIDGAIATLITDLKDRGLLDSTLIVWMGEFGRTPNINTRSDKPGRDHYPKAWSLAMWGGGLKGGQVYGKTDKEGATVAENSVNTGDFLATVCEVLGIDHTKENMAGNGRPIRLVDKGNKPFTKSIV
jgi:hypothetical protein